MSRHQVWAGPMVFGNWVAVANHLGSADFTITVEPIGDTVVVGQVRYFDRQNQHVTEDFNGEVSISTGNSVATVEVRLKGGVSGSSCWVDVSP